MFYRFTLLKSLTNRMRPIIGHPDQRKPLSFNLPLSLSTRKNRSCLSRFRSGDEAAYSEIYQRFQKPILRHVRKRISDEAVAEEITQEIFLKVHRFREGYQPEFAFSTWLWTIARNTISDHLRARKDARGDHDFMIEEIPCTSLCAETLIMKKDQRRHLFRIARTLTRLQRRVLWLRMIHHLTFQEIAAKLNLSLTAVKNLAYRAKLNLGEDVSGMLVL